MTERTVTVQTEQEETITLCDHCGLSDDAGEIVTYVPMPTEPKEVFEESIDKEQWNEEWHTLLRDYEIVHMHRSCLDDMGVDVPEATTYSELVPKSHHSDGAVNFALDNAGAGMIIGAMALTTLAGYLFSNSSLVFPIIGLSVALIFVAGVFAKGQKRAEMAVEELQ